MRVFLDTNILVSTFATRGLCADVLRHVLSEHVLVMSEVVLRELRKALRVKLKLPAATVEEIASLPGFNYELAHRVLTHLQVARQARA